ncbi:MAG TPA: hydrogenase [Lentisphaeria bacterium]|nr:MAG: hydrogenase [Lentisphaerae bacterium GWF2_49_21]HBC86954.1 hydrogenase [Lentisphaeria bacterium]
MAQVGFIAALILSPLIPGIINRTKAVFAGRQGPPLLQLYYDLFKLLRKGAVYSNTTTWVFRAAPIVSLSAVIGVLMLIPCTGATPALISFQGDIIFFAYLFGISRFFTVTAALDTGSAFEGMGASREVLYAALAEPAFLIALSSLACLNNQISITGIFIASTANPFANIAVILLVAVTLTIVLLTENCRVPADDPNTHLELTMIHEVMVLDYGGSDLAYILYGSALKLWAFASILVAIVLPARTGSLFLDSAVFVGGIFIVAVIVGVIESTMARFRLDKIPKMLIAAAALSATALLLTITRG